ncbi:ribonuclease D [Gardnerella vaginalis 55152]|uniref:Ribonuclease D n=2 Tax=Gardnerella vaginalis TaxID=2702 RepID=I4LT61_GARVA|nr:HRDC domain-containing protein [Gardnerella vaginalis]EIK80151.1 ribonuclease D [Gardnerella vaginalis 55152]EIK80966.1 ribonuclease D [Gardnerella vaginalis 1400E]
MNEEPKLLKEPREGVPEVIDTLEAYKDYCSLLAAGSGPLAADAERASGFRYGHEDWLIQFKRKGAGIGLLDPIELTKLGADWNEFNKAVGDAPWIIHDSMQDLPGFFDIGLRPLALFDTEIAAKLLGRKRFGLSSVTEYYLGLTLAKEHSAADWSYRPLPRDWRNYAALDVELLIELEEVMRAELKKQGKLLWANQEFAHLLSKGAQKKAPHPNPWLRISHINVLMHDKIGLMIAKELWQKRDELARQYDIAPTLLLSDAAIIEAGKRKPSNSREFRSIRILNERVRIHTGSEQDKMFERYAPIQRKIKPNVWKVVIEDAISRAKSGEVAIIDYTQSSNDEDDCDCPNESSLIAKNAQDVQESQAAPRSMKYWREHHPKRYERLQNVKQSLIKIAEDTHTPTEIIIKPQIIRNLCWQDDVEHINVKEFLDEQGARMWQSDLIAESVTRAIM